MTREEIQREIDMLEAKRLELLSIKSNKMEQSNSFIHFLRNEVGSIKNSLDEIESLNVTGVKHNIK